eukprot:gene38310-47297_t
MPNSRSVANQNSCACVIVDLPQCTYFFLENTLALSQRPHCTPAPADQLCRSAPPAGRYAGRMNQSPTELRDTRGRPLKDLRLSVIDQCNFRCPYCMPKESYGPDYAFMTSSERLSFGQLARLARSFVQLGVEKIRITGGEPLLRKDLPRLIETLAAMRTLEGHPLDIALTTNGALLAARAQSLKDAGLRRITVSLDSLDDALAGRMNGVNFPVARVLEGIAAAQRAGLAPVKINTVIERGVNDSQILPLVHHFRDSGVQLRFIEYMDVGGASRWNAGQVLSADAMRAIVQQHYPLVQDSAARGGVGGAQGREPHLGCGLAQGAGKRLQLHFFGKGGVAWVVQRGGGALYRFAVRARAAWQVNLQLQAQLLCHLVGKAVGGFGVVAVVHPHHGHIGVHLRDHVQDHRLKGAEVGGNDGGLAQAQRPCHQFWGVAAEVGVDACEIELAHGAGLWKVVTGFSGRSAVGKQRLGVHGVALVEAREQCELALGIRGIHAFGQHRAAKTRALHLHQLVDEHIARGADFARKATAAAQQEGLAESAACCGRTSWDCP